MRGCALFLAAVLLAPAVVLAANGQGNAETQTADTAITLYNQGPAVVWQTRELSLNSGIQTLVWPSTPTQLLPESLWLAGDGVMLEAATVNGAASNNPTAMLAARVGQSVTLLPADGGKPRQATLMSVAGSTAVVRVDDRFELIDSNSALRIAWPAESSTGLQLTVHADNAGRQPVTLAYQRGGITWHASYTGRYAAKEGTLTLQSLAVIENTSGDPARADHLALIAGDVARTAGGAPRPMLMARAATVESFAAPQQADGYYRYTLDTPLDLESGATRIVALMGAQVLDSEREYRIENVWYTGDTIQRDHAKIRLSFKNSTGVPLPAGPVRVYGQSQAMLLGEDHIGNTPVGAPVALTLGQAFDITAARGVVKSSRQGDKHRQTVEITLHNARREAVTVTVVEHPPKGAEIVSESAEHESKTASKAIWEVGVPGKGETTLTYTAAWTR